MNQDLKKLALSVMTARKAKGLTQQQLADALFIDGSTISRLERGINLCRRTLYSACRELGLRIESIVETEGWEP